MQGSSLHEMLNLDLRGLLTIDKYQGLLLPAKE